MNIDSENIQTFDDVIAKPEGREQFNERILYLAREKEALKRKADLFATDVESTADAFKISKTQLNKIVDSMSKGKVSEVLTQTVLLADALEVLKGFNSPDSEDVE